MRTKEPLVLMEQVVMILVFALAAALCVQVFAYADRTSRYYEMRDQAVLQVQNEAELLKRQANQSGDTDYQRFYDENWELVPEEFDDAAYCLTVDYQESEEPCLWLAEVSVAATDGEELFSLPVAGQKEGVQ
jgi:hypothetical protein